MDEAPRQTPPPRRLVPDEPLPPYAYVPGQHPHPISDPSGHSYNRNHEQPARFDADDWAASRAYLLGCDLFNHGYYWEAHEAWESAWLACGRSGTAADFLKGLIKLAAAGVKARQRRPAGVRRHAARAHELFRQVGRACRQPRYAGLDVRELEAFAAKVERQPPTDDSDDPGVRVGFDFVLFPRGAADASWGG